LNIYFNGDLAISNEYLTVFSALATISSIILVMLWTNKRFQRFDRLADCFSELFRYEEDENGNPMLDARLVKIIEALGSSVAKSLKFSLLGSISGQARLEKGLKGAIAQDIVEQNMPILNLIGDFLGINTRKYIAKHPEAAMQLFKHFAPMFMQFKFKHSNPGAYGPYKTF